MEDLRKGTYETASKWKTQTSFSFRRQNAQDKSWKQSSENVGTTAIPTR